MYFAAILFNVSLLVAVIVSLATKPDEEFRVRSLLDIFKDLFFSILIKSI